MGFGENLVFLRKITNNMSQEKLAEKLGISRQTVSKWELNSCYPEMEKVIELCKVFSCTMDELIQFDMSACNEACSNIRTETLEPFSYIRYAVVSMEPEEDAINHIGKWAATLKLDNPTVIGWDFPCVSGEQVNVYHMHGYAAALVIPEDKLASLPKEAEVIRQQKQKYLAITVKEPFVAPFQLIPNAYKTLMYSIKANNLSEKEPDDVISCFEKEYVKDGIAYMDIYMAIA